MTDIKNPFYNYIAHDDTIMGIKTWYVSDLKSKFLLSHSYHDSDITSKWTFFLHQLSVGLIGEKIICHDE
jgi:competence protein ComGF